MTDFKLTYCRSCDSVSSHEIYKSTGGYLHSLCMDCGKDSSSESRVAEVNGTANKPCKKCATNTEHLKYISEGGYIHWFCCSCGFDISSDSRVR